jgi:NADH-quinone oxidoreductase subunit J
VIAFWVLAPVITLAALGVLFVRKAVHAALLLAVVMVSLAVLYLVLEAPFLFAVQIIVYTGAIMMLFLFVLMLVGVDSSDSVVETIRGQRVLAVVAGLGLGLLLVVALSQLALGTATGLGAVNAGGNIEALAQLLFSTYVLAFEVTAALLVTAALGAMVLAHRERLVPKATQADLAAQRVRDFSEKGLHLGPLPPPGVYARHNAVGTPALLPDGSVAETSLSRVLSARGATTSAPRDINAIQAEIDASVAPYGRVVGGGTTSTRPAPVAGAADTSTADVDVARSEVVGQPDDLPDAGEPDPITRVLDDARADDAHAQDGEAGR